MKTFINLAFGGIVVLFGIVFLFQPVGQVPPPTDSAQVAQASSVQPTATENADEEAVDGTTQKEPTIYETAILTAFGEQTRDTEKGSDAADFVAMTINMGGHLCAQPVEAKKASGHQYGIGCLTRNGSSHRSNYLLDIDNGDVTAL